MVIVMFTSGEQKSYKADSAVLRGNFFVLYAYNPKSRKSESCETIPAGNVAWAKSSDGKITVGPPQR
jgi:hypothetical protein